MFLDLKEFLSKNVDPVRGGMINAAVHELANHGEVSSYSEISRLLNTANMDSIAGILDGIETIVNTGLNLVLRAFTIEVTEEATIAIKTDILEGLRVLETYEDSETILAMCEESGDSNETLSKLLELVTTRTWADYSDVILNLSHTLIEQLSDKHSVNIENNSDVIVTFEDKRKDAVMRFITKYPVSMAKTAILQDQVQFGTPFNILKQDCVEQLQSFEPFAPAQLAVEMVGLGLISDLSFNNISRETKDKLEEMFTDPDFVSKVVISMDRVFDEVLKDG